MFGSGISLADIAAVSGNGRNNGGFGGDGNGWWVLIILFALFGGWGGNGLGNGGGQGALTRGDLCQDMNFSDLESGVRGISQGICDSTFALNNTIVNGFAGVDNAVCTLGYNMQQGFNAANIAMLQGFNAIQAKQAECCCENRAAIAQVRYDMAQSTCALAQAIQGVGTQIHEELLQGRLQAKDEKIAEQASLIQSLNLAASQANQNQYLINQLRPCPVPAFITCNPYAYTQNSGCNGNMGCCG